ncbi:phytanoyl-CoA dioxygenase family protein [Dietzia alimentaria]|uniref:phytanoyl-CoA dioxygenase family protein n=1 Tax=Dietzia alimentaria TaxID=665550 RepID=UPI00029A3DF1|nr:phytanoyl-CoA dioxygenase family protein [Dietzia alimentaria]
MTLAVDDYTTRVSGAPAILDRPDPVVWSGTDDPEIARFADRGYIQREGALDGAQVDACLEEMRRIGSDPAMADDPRVIRESGSEAVRSIFDVHELSDVVWEAVNRSGAIELAREILGSDVYVHQSRLNYKPGFAGGAFYWHSDFETWHAEDGMPRPRACSASLALTRNEVYNGPLMIMPGTQKYFVQCAGETPDDYYRESLVSTTPRVGVPSEEHIAELYRSHGLDVLTGGAGSMTMFDCNALHASGGNITPIPRANVFVVFNSVENGLSEPYAGTPPRPEFLARRP